MYLPKHFEQSDDAELARIIAAYPFGSLVHAGAGGLDANHLPFFLDEEGGRRTLVAHVARANPLWQEAKDGDEVLVIFRAADAYVSPNWYPSKHEAHKQVPTWIYRVVNVHGRLRIRDDAKFVRGVVARLTRTHEAQASALPGARQPWKMGDAPADYLEQMVAAIVGIEVEVTRMAGKWKLSQNKEARDRAGAADELEKRGEAVLAAAMRESLGKG